MRSNYEKVDGFLVKLFERGWSKVLARSLIKDVHTYLTINRVFIIEVKFLTSYSLFVAFRSDRSHSNQRMPSLVV